MASSTAPLKSQIKSLIKKLEKKSEHLRLLSSVVKTANSIMDPDVIMEVIMEKVRGLVPSQAWSLLLVDESREHLIFKVALGKKSDRIANQKLKIDSGIAGWVATTGEPIIVNDVKNHPRFYSKMDSMSGFKTKSILAAPLVSRSKTIGVIEIINKTEGDFTEEDRDIVMLFIEPAATALENAFLFKKIEELTIVDDLTKLYNSRYLRIALDNEIQRATRYSYPVSVIFLDLDGFKSVNDKYGHLVGSQTLSLVGGIIKQCVRTIDVVSRYGGDEFTIILPNASSKQTLEVAERIRKHIKEFPYCEKTGLNITLSASFGIASYPEHGKNREDLINLSDKAMYMVKESTKNAVAIADGLSPDSNTQRLQQG